MSKPRATRPIPNRTHPNRNILGVFGQSAWRAPDSFGHPLGPGFGEDHSTAAAAPEFMDEHVMQASDLVDRHIAEAQAENAGRDDGWLGNIAGLYAGAGGGDLTAVIASLTRSYAEAASKWVDLASTLAKNLGQMQAQGPQAAGTTGLGAAGPVLSIRAAAPVEARVEMFRACLSLSAQPLSSDDPANDARITDVTVEDGCLKLRVSADQPPGTYYGLLLETGAGPAGVLTVQVFESDAP